MPKYSGLALGQQYDFPSSSEVTLKTRAVQGRTKNDKVQVVCLVLGIYYESIKTGFLYWTAYVF